jgi:hypothetical protein
MGQLVVLWSACVHIVRPSDDAPKAFMLQKRRISSVSALAVDA